MDTTIAARSPFALLELPDGRWYVAKPATAETTALVAGSFARLEPAYETPGEKTRTSPVGVYASRDEAELAIQRADTSPLDPLAPFAAWLRQD